MILDQETFEAFGYYPNDLKHHSNKRILAYCDLCGKLRVTTKVAYRTFCHSCSQIFGEVLRGGTLSEEHKRKISVNHADVNSGNNPNFCKRGPECSWWKGGKVERVCKVCGKTFYAPQAIIKRGEGKYCSHSCATKARIHNAKPNMTAPEKAFEAICKKHQLPFKFVGNGSLWLGNANPDFAHTNKKIALEVFGDYWHSPLLNRNISEVQTVEGRTKQLAAEGYKTIILWESDLMRVDAEEFILHYLLDRQ